MNEEDKHDFFKDLKNIVDNYGPVNSHCNENECDTCYFHYTRWNEGECVLDVITDWVKEHK